MNKNMKYARTLASILAILYLAAPCQAKIGPPYPVTASWFADRFTKQEWDTTLDEFSKIGGDTVLLRGATLRVRTKEDIMGDAKFAGCMLPSKDGGKLIHCVQDAEDELKAAEVLIAGYATYEYEENFSDRIMHCPQKLDRKITTTSKTYHRLVITDLSFDCEFEANETAAIVVITSFSGVDPHELLMQSAAERNMSVYLGMPGSIDISTLDVDHDRKVYLYEGYFYFLFYVLDEHNIRFGMNGSHIVQRQSSAFREKLAFHHKLSRDRVRSYCAGMHSQQFQKALQNLNNYKMNAPHKVKGHATALQKAAAKSFSGYFIRKDVVLTRFVISDSSKDVLGLPEACFFFQIDETIQFVNENRSFAVSAEINLQKQFKNSTTQQHADGLKSFFTNAASLYQGTSVLILHEGRGSGKAAHYDPSEENVAISKDDPVLYDILTKTVPNINLTTTYSDVYTNSTRQLFPELMKAFKNVTAGHPDFPNSTAQLWVMIESYEYLHDNPCLPIDSRGSGMDLPIQRTTKQRIDMSLSALGGFPNKMAAFAWDSDFLCHDNLSKSLTDDILQDSNRPIITSCGFDTPPNLSIAVTGFINIDGQVPFMISYMDSKSKLHTLKMYGAYYDPEYGIKHHKVPSLVYIMLPSMHGLDLKQSGYITVEQGDAYHACTFAYTL